MRANEFLNQTELAEMGIGEAPSTKAADDATQQRIRAKKRTLADIKRDLELDKWQADKRSMGERLADIVRKHREQTIKLSR